MTRIYILALCNTLVCGVQRNAAKCAEATLIEAAMGYLWLCGEVTTAGVIYSSTLAVHIEGALVVCTIK